MPQSAPRTLIMLIALIFCLAIPALAAPPATISYQGELYDSSGQPITGTVDLVVAIYDSAEGVSSLWSDVFSVEVADGVFSVVLGSQTPLDLDFDQPYWLGVTVGADPEMTPRTPLSSAPYALRAVNADTADTATSVESSAAVTSFNAATGAMTIAGSAPISVDTTDQIITISSSAVTGLTNGEGIAIAGTASDPEVSVKFEGTGSATSAARSDHNHDSTYYTQTALQTSGSAAVHWDNLTNKPTLVGPYANLIIVAKSGGQFTTIQDACDSITDASESNPYLIWVGPGVYTERVAPPDYVSLQGAGRGQTIINGLGNKLYVIIAGDHSEISDLSVTHQRTGNSSVGIKVSGGYSVEITRVQVTVQGESSSTVVALFCYQDNVVRLRQVILSATGDAASGGVYGIYAENTDLDLDLGEISVTGGNNANGIKYRAAYTDQVQEALISNSTLTAAGGATNTRALFVEDTGLTGDGRHSRVRVRNSRFISEGRAVYTNTVNCTALLAGCELDGGVSGSGTETCVACFDGDYTALGTDCQAIP